MAKSYYGFDTLTGYSPTIDFKSVRQEIDKELATIGEAREAKKKVIEENTKAAMEAIDEDKGTGELTDLNRSLHNVSDQIKDQVLLQYNLMTTGKVKPSAFNKFVEGSKQSISNIKTMAESYQQRALDIQQPGVAAIETHLSQDVLDLNFFSENAFFSNPSTGDIYLAAVNEDGSIKLDENGNIVNKKSPYYMQSTRQATIMETDFDGEVNAIVEKYGMDVTSVAGQTSEYVDAAYKDIQTRVHSLDNLEVGDLLSQMLPNSRFDYTDSKEEAQQSIDKWSELNSRYSEQYLITQNEDSTDDEKTAAENQMRIIRQEMDNVKIFMYAATPESGAPGIIDMEVDDVHRLIAHDIYETMFRSKMGTATNANLAPTQRDRGRSDDRNLANNYYRQMKDAWTMINSGDQNTIQAGVSKMVAVYRGLGVNVVTGGVTTNGYFELTDPNGQQFIAANLKEESSSINGFNSLIVGLGNTKLGVHFSNKTTDSSPFSFEWNAPPTGVEIGTIQEAVVTE